ncbi:hypothetical protein AC249_AIPGENE28175 [Exaiptasia diaphana]|nr:hypothetical protein AC249_AIPGENE28175 [Exaiptasia diaphana]
MPSTTSMIKSSKAKPREIQHSIIDARGGIENVRSSGEYPRDRCQIYSARRSKEDLPSKVGIASDPLLQLVQISKEQQQGEKGECLSSLMVKYRPETQGVLVYGSDGEDNLSSAMARVFGAEAKHLRCNIHLRDNIKSALAKLHIKGAAARQIERYIFGYDLGGNEREGGLVDCT